MCFVLFRWTQKINSQLSVGLFDIYSTSTTILHINFVKFKLWIRNCNMDVLVTVYAFQLNCYGSKTNFWRLQLNWWPKWRFTIDKLVNSMFYKKSSKLDLKKQLLLEFCSTFDISHHRLLKSCIQWPQIKEPNSMQVLKEVLKDALRLKRQFRVLTMFSGECF